MNYFKLPLKFKEIRERIEIDSNKYEAGKWAELIKVKKSLISNVHGKNKKQNPPLPYIIAVAQFTGKPIEWYLYGSPQTTHTVAESGAGYNENFMCGWTEEQKEACRILKEILDSGDKIAIAAILSNLAAFRESIRKNSRIDKLEKDVRELKKGRRSSSSRTHTSTAKSATKQKAM